MIRIARRAIKATLKSFITTVVGINEVLEGVLVNNVGPFPCAIIRLPNEDETRQSLPVIYGRKKRETTVRLLLVDLDPDADTIRGELAFDDLVDKVLDELRKHPTIEGVETVLQLGPRIRTKVAEPMLSGQPTGGMFRGATFEFEVIEHIVG